VKSIHIAVETENVLVAGIIVSQPAKIFNLGGRDHTRSIRQHNGVSRGDNRHVVVESGAKRSDEDEARDHMARGPYRGAGVLRMMAEDWTSPNQHMNNASCR
jgi:hypothetical protein